MSSLPFQLIQPPFLRNSPPSSSSANSSQPSSPNASKGKNRVGRPRPVSLPNLAAQNLQQEPAQTDEFTSLEGVATNVKLILKLLQETNDATKEDDGRKSHRLAGMLRILDDVRSRIEFCSQRASRRDAELCRSSTDLFRGPLPTSPTSNCHPACTSALSPRGTQPRKSLLVEHHSPTDEENQKLRRELSASMTARKSLERMFSSLGREKEMIAGELARKVQELSCMEELVADLKAENKMLSEKVWACAVEHRGHGSGGGGAAEEELRAMQDRNAELTEQLMKSLEGYKAAKRKLREAQEEVTKMREAAGAAAGRLRRLRERGGPVAAGEETAELEKVWEKLAKR